MLKKLQPYSIDQNLLNGREIGREIKDVILKELEKGPIDIILPLDFSKVEFIDFSFTDEMLGKLLRRILSGELGERYIVLQSLNDSAKENINVALKERELACVYINSQGSIEILGKISEELKETYFKAVNKGTITAREVLEIFKLQTISAASNRLTRLQKLGLLCKSKDEVINGGGRQYVYEPVK